MPTQMSHARAGKITEEMRWVAAQEEMTAEEIREGVATGQIIIPKNVNHEFAPRAIGAWIKTKVNANIGVSSDHGSLEEELEKLECAIEYNADSVMDLSSGDLDLDHIRTSIVNGSSLMVGTVPVYQVIGDAFHKQKKNLWDITGDDFFEVLERQARQGVDYFTVHVGMTLSALKYVDDRQRIVGIVSKGGASHAAWMRYTREENPLFARFDELCELCREYDVTLSLGDSLRPGGTGDATDAAQIHELITLGELTKRAWKHDVQVMVEGPGHVPINQIEANVQLQQRLCHGAPFYVLGPLSIDTAPGYDHITGAIGGAIAAAAGVAMLCYVTPAEHLRLPTVDDVREGVMATRIAAASGDLAKKVKYAKRHNDEMSRYRKALDWEGMYRVALDPKKAREYRMQSEDYDSDVCTMCGDLCAVRMDNMTDRKPITGAKIPFAEARRRREMSVTGNAADASAPASGPGAAVVAAAE
jgi:phosphomethylpyrimidine synthase